MPECYSWTLFVIAWLITGHTIAIMVIYSFGFIGGENKEAENRDIYRYVKFLLPFFRNPLPDPNSGTTFYFRIKKGISLFLITCQTVITITIAILVFIYNENI